MDFLLVSIEFFSLGVMAEVLRPKIHRKLAISLKCGQFDPKLKLKLKTNLYSTIKSKDPEALDSGTSRLSSQREYGEIKMF